MLPQLRHISVWHHLIIYKLFALPLEQLLALLLLIGMGIVIYLLYTRRSLLAPATTTDVAQIQILVSLIADLQRQLQETDVRTRQEIQERLDVVIRQISTHQQQNAQQIIQQQSQSSSLIQQITTKLSQIENTNKQVLSFTEQMRGLEKVFSSPKQRGMVGEFLLEALLANILPSNQYKIQYRFKTGIMVDAAIFFKDKIVPIDAKFPLEKYNRLQNTDNLQLKADLEKQFKTDLKNRIDETAKYVLPNENTTNFALMFVPAEGIFYQLLQYTTTTLDGRTADLMVYGFQKHVIIVSPATFYAYLETVLHGLNALQIEQSVREVIQKIGDLQRHLQSYEDQLLRLGKQMQTTQATYEQTKREFDKIDKAITQINTANNATEKPNDKLF